MTLRDNIVEQLQEQAPELSSERLNQLADRITSEIGNNDKVQALPLQQLSLKLPPTIQVMLAHDHSSIENAAQYAIQILVAQVDTDVQAKVPERYQTGPFCPFPGLSAFDDANARYYFGRAAEIDAFLNRLEAPLTAITGASGIGKSSFLMAGILPRLKAAGKAEDDSFLVFRDFGSSDLLSAFATALAIDAPEKLVQGMGQNAHGLVEALWQTYGVNGNHVTVILDQFEGLFVNDDATRVSERDTFLDNLLALNDHGHPPFITVIISTRENFYEHPAYLARPTLDGILRRDSFVLRALDAAQLRQAMEEPVARFNDQFGTNLRFENNLTAVIANAFKHDATHSLPLVQYLLRLMWIEKRELTYQAYFGLGQLDKALDRHANDIYQTLPDSDKPLAKALLLALVRPGISGRYARKRVPAAKFLTGKTRQERQIFESILGRFTNAQSRLISTQSSGDIVYYELTHDILLRQWSTLTTLIEANHARLALRESLLPKAEAWWKSRQTKGPQGDRGELFVGNELQRAQEYLTQDDSPEGQDSTIASCYAASHRFRRQRIVRNSIIALVLLLGFLATVLFLQSQTDVAETQNAITQATATRQRLDSAATEAALGTQQAQDRATSAARATEQTIAVATGAARATEQTIAEATGAAQATQSAQSAAALDAEATLRAEAEASQAAEAEMNDSLELIAEANRLLQQPDGDTELAVLLTLHALANTPSNEGQTALATGLARLRSLVKLNDAISPDALPDDRTEAMVEISPDGRLLVYQAWQDNTLRVHEADSGRLVWTLTGHRSLVTSVTFTQDSSQMISAGRDGRVILWNLETDGDVRTLYTDGGPLTAIDLNKAEDTLLIGDTLGRLSTLPFPEGETASLLVNFDGEIGDAKFTSDDETILIALTDSSRIVLWSLSTQTDIYTQRVSWPIFSFSFSPDGSEFVSSVLGRQVEIRTVADGETRLQISLDSAIALARFTPDGDQIVTASSDLLLTERNNLGRSSLIEFWRSDNGSREHFFRGHNSIYVGMTLPDNDRLAVVGLDGSVRILATEPILNESGSVRLPGPHLFGMWGYDLSADGRYLLSTGTFFNAINLVSANRDEAEAEPFPFKDDQIGIIDTHSGALLTDLTIPDAILFGQFSPDGKLVMILSEQGASSARLVTIWEWATGEIVFSYSAQPESLAGWFLPGGNYLLAHEADGRVALVTLGENREPIYFASGNDFFQPAQVLPVAHSDMVLTVSLENRVQLWDALSGSLLSEEAVLLDGPVTFVDFSEDQRFAVLVHERTGSVIDLSTMGVAYTFEDVSSDDQVGFSASGAYRIHIASRLLISDIELETWRPGSLFAHEITMEHDFVFKEVRLTPDGKTIVATSGPLSNRITGWDAETGDPLYSFEQSDIGSALSLSPDGTFFTLGVLSVNARIPVWEARSGQLIRALELAEKGLFNMVMASFSESGNYIITINLPLMTISQVEAFSTGVELTESDLSSVSELWPIDYQALACGMVFRSLTAFEKSEYGIVTPEPICPLVE